MTADAAPRDARALHSEAIAAFRGGRLEEARQRLALAVAQAPALAEAHSDLGIVLQLMGRPLEALECFERALALRPSLLGAVVNRPIVELAIGRHEAALASSDSALRVAPDNVDVLNARGVALYGLARPEEAIACFDRALAVDPKSAKTWQNRGIALAFLRRQEDAARDLDRALALDPTLEFAEGALMRARLQCCDWSDFAGLRARIAAAIRGGQRSCDALTFLALADSAADALSCARIWATRYPPLVAPLWRGERYGHERIRVAYLSSDFHEHATAYLMAQVFERHDRARFEVSAVSWDVEAPGAMRRRLKAAFEHFEDVRGMDDVAVARWLREREIDVAVDLKGYTFEARPGILAQRPCPVAVSYLGYPGTMGAGYVDYLLADETVIPAQDRAHYAEQVVYLPGSYQANDGKRAVGAATPTRAELGLPESGFVYCSFNNSYKITPEMFEVWMRVMRAVPGSVLWLLEGNPEVPGNLRREAQLRGVAGERLVFAPRAPLAEHLARQRNADLFLDTLPCNAHTTASDALWVGLPVLTCLGHTFAGRVAGSLLRAVGLPELVTQTPAEYGALAQRLASEPALLASLRERLVRNRTSSSLFDGERMCRHLEAAFRTMWERSEAGLPPAGFAVPR